MTRSHTLVQFLIKTASGDLLRRPDTKKHYQIKHMSSSQVRPRTASSHLGIRRVCYLSHSMTIAFGCARCLGLGYACKGVRLPSHDRKLLYKNIASVRKPPRPVSGGRGNRNCLIFKKRTLIINNLLIVAARGLEPRPHVCCPYTMRLPYLIVQHDPCTGYASTGHHYSLSSPTARLPRPFATCSLSTRFPLFFM